MLRYKEVWQTEEKLLADSSIFFRSESEKIETQKIRNRFSTNFSSRNVKCCFLRPGRNFFSIGVQNYTKLKNLIKKVNLKVQPLDTRIAFLKPTKNFGRNPKIYALIIRELSKFEKISRRNFSRRNVHVDTLNAALLTMPDCFWPDSGKIRTKVWK